jgi:hypothetical protein
MTALHQADALYLGATKVVAVHLGATRVWPPVVQAAVATVAVSTAVATAPAGLPSREKGA